MWHPGPQRLAQGGILKKPCWSPAGNAAAKASKFIVYPDAPHAFHADYRPSYREEAAKAGWKEALEWFDTHLK